MSNKPWLWLKMNRNSSAKPFYSWTKSIGSTNCSRIFFCRMWKVEPSHWSARPPRIHRFRWIRHYWADVVSLCWRNWRPTMFWKFCDVPCLPSMPSLWIQPLRIHLSVILALCPGSDHTISIISCVCNRICRLRRVLVEESSLKWLADISDGDARIALNSLQLAMESVIDNGNCDKKFNLKHMTLDAIQDGIKRSHMLYDRKGDQHYDMISALHKSIRASDDNAALYWCTRMMEGGEDPRYICRRMVRAASEDIGTSYAKTMNDSCLFNYRWIINVLNLSRAGWSQGDWHCAVRFGCCPVSWHARIRLYHRAVRGIFGQSA